MSWNKLISEKAMDIVVHYEEGEGRYIERVHLDGVGYDILSRDLEEERYIEVKATSESWSTYSWLPLYNSEVEALKKNPKQFYLYIVRFELDRQNRDEQSLDAANYDIYIINGDSLLKEFKIKPESFSVSPISKSKLEKFKNSRRNKIISSYV